jgi:hypothetical protein
VAVASISSLPALGIDCEGFEFPQVPAAANPEIKPTATAPVENGRPLR